MNRLPTLNSTKILKALQRAGFKVQRHDGTGHVMLLHPVTGRQTVIPIHSRDMKRGLMKAILKQTGLTEDRFRELL